MSIDLDVEFHVCDAYNMARELFEDDEIVPCFEGADREVHGYWLCDECAWALETFTEISERVTETKRPKGFFERIRLFFVAMFRGVFR